MNLHRISIAVITLLALSLSSAVYSMDYGNGRENLTPSLLLENSNGQNDHWKGIGRLIINASYPDAYCTASLIDTRDKGLDGPAYVLTSGHCISLDSANVTMGEHSDGHIDFNYFQDTAQDHLRFKLKQVNWSSLRGQDMAIVELDVSLQTLMDKGIQPLSLGTAAPASGAPLLIVGAPSQYPEKGVRLSACSHVATETLVEQHSVLRGFYKNHCAGLKPGSSGSPLLDRHSNEILGVVSTSTAGALPENRCSQNAPCELKSGQPHWSADTHYVSPTGYLQSCFVQGQFSATARGCDLLPTVTLSQKRATVNYYRRVKYDAEGNVVLPTWKFQFSLDSPFYRSKPVRDPQLCENTEDYSQALEAEDVLINDPVGQEPGLYFLCIIGVDSPAQSPTRAMMKNPLVIAKEIAEPGPTHVPRADITRQENGSYIVAWQFSHPVLSGYEAKTGAQAEMDCDDPQGYVRQLDDLNIAANDLPVKLCIKAFDMSGQRSLPRTELLSN